MIRKYQILGATVHGFTTKTLTEKVLENTANKYAPTLVVNHNLHSLYLFHKYERLRRFYAQADFIHIDGMSLVYLGKLLFLDLIRENRITYVDWLDDLFEKLDEGRKKVFYLGSKPGVAEKAALLLREKYSKVEIRTKDGYFDVAGEENSHVVNEINEFQPDILMVGMSMPRQEFWVMENYSKLRVGVVLTSGACFDYVAGEVKTPPRSWGRFGLEWLYRLWTEPARLWKRYLLEPIELIFLLLKRK